MTIQNCTARVLTLLLKPEQAAAPEGLALAEEIAAVDWQTPDELDTAQALIIRLGIARRQGERLARQRKRGGQLAC